MLISYNRHSSSHLHQNEAGYRVLLAQTRAAHSNRTMLSNNPSEHDTDMPYAQYICKYKQLTHMPTFFFQKLLELKEVDINSAINGVHPDTTSPSSASFPSSPSPAVKVDRVSLSWNADGEKKVLSDISFTIDKVSS